MPSLKMKTMSTTGLKEMNGLHVCRNSKMITKKPLSCAKISQNAELGTDNQTRDGVTICERLNKEDLGRNYVNHDDSSNVNTVIDEEPVTSTSSPSTDTIFSPILESIDIHNNEGFDDLYMPQLDSEDSEDSSRSSSEFHACNVSDFYISDMIFSVPPFESNSIFDNKTDTMFFPDYYKCDETSLLCDLTEEYMILPFLEDALDTIHDHDGKPSQETVINADNSSLYMAIHQMKSYNQENQINPYPDTDYEWFDPQMYIRNLPDQQENGFLLPASMNEKHNNNKITLVLDLDETLVHSSLEQCESADFTFPVYYNMKEHTVYVKRRPHLQTFLEKVAEMFEIVIFTASQSIYAKQLLDILDPDGKFVSRRAYRESCILSEGCYVKDLTVLGVDLAKVAIIDNSPQVFKLQVNNGIPIQSWFDDPSDCALISLLPFLESLVDADDVRAIIARKFGNKE